jgi:methyl-accepting chemotaxis protein
MCYAPPHGRKVTGWLRTQHACGWPPQGLWMTWMRRGIGHAKGENMKRWLPQRDSEKELERRARQIKEIVRLGSTLRADLSPHDIFHLLVTSINRTTGFTVAALNLVHERQDALDIVATAGLSPEERHRLKVMAPELSHLKAAMLPEFRISNSYFIPHEHKHLLAGAGGVTVYRQTSPGAPRAADAWDPEDVLLVPLLSPRDGHLLGILSLDAPEDGRRPAEETIEILEIFANQAALAIENTRILHGREDDRGALERGLEQLLDVLQAVRQGDLSVRSTVPANVLGQIAQALNAVLTTLGGLLVEVRASEQVAALSAGEARAGAAQLAANAQEQARQILWASGEVEALADSIQRIAATATAASAPAIEAIELSTSGREVAEQAAQGMRQVQEMVIQSARRLQRLGKQAQEIEQIVALVAEFAQQTNLLALNAAIEAAHAGDSNAAFARFAAEIRKLANSSDEAAREITTRIAAIQTETTALVGALERGADQVTKQAELVARTGSALEAVNLATQHVASAIHTINAAATQHADTAHGLSAAMTGIASVSAQTRDHMDAMSAAMDDLIERANALLRKLRYFRLTGATDAPLPSLHATPGAGAEPRPFPPSAHAGYPLHMDSAPPDSADIAAGPHTSRSSQPSQPLRALTAAPRLTPLDGAAPPLSPSQGSNAHD